ncbi:MAG TPA: hypothetical protein VLX60_13220 [Terriglobales bacterium]|nr:hypothetical protein [Terriglobales bacterium]
MKFATNIDIYYEFAHHLVMRTTLSIDDEVLEIVKQYAEDRSMTVGDAVTELIRKAFRTPTPTKIVNGLRVFDLPPDSPVVTDQKLLELEEE